MDEPFKRDFHRDIVARFRGLKNLADRAIEQVPEEELTVQLDEESNSVAHLVKHLAGNMHSRWKDFLTSDGEKPDRNRDAEFETSPDDTPDQLRRRWEDGWKVLFDELEPLTYEQLDRTVHIRGEPHQVVEAINRQFAHVAYHVGQLVFLAKHFRGKDWNTLSIPRGKSREYIREMQKTQPEAKGQGGP